MLGRTRRAFVHLRQDGGRLSLQRANSHARRADFCFWHHPDHKSGCRRRQATRWQLRRRREKAIEGAYDLARRSPTPTGGISGDVLEAITSKDLLSMEPSIGRTNALLRVVRERSPPG